MENFSILKPAIKMRICTWLAACILILCCSGCADLSYYLHSVNGQMQILSARQSITDVIADPATSPALKARLRRVLDIRNFASHELDLPDNLSYRGYADLRRPYVVWNVFATPEFSVTPMRWCFLVAGCVNYRGYFSQAEADDYAAQLRSRLLDVYEGGVPAYSTLGWFDDPVLNTVINYPDYELARLIFHELAHQVVYVKGDSEFNESFAVTVEEEGTRRWLLKEGDDRMRADFDRAQQRRVGFLALVLEYRTRLDQLFQTPQPDEQMRADKQKLYADMQHDYESLKQQWGGYGGYDHFFADINNAHLASIAIYSALVPQFRRMLELCDGDLPKFFAEVKALAAMPKARRAERLQHNAS